MARGMKVRGTPNWVHSGVWGPPYSATLRVSVKVRFRVGLIMIGFITVLRASRSHLTGGADMYVERVCGKF